MAIDWNLALGAPKAGDFLDAFNSGQADAIKLENAKAAQAAAQQQQAASAQYHSQVANLLRGGDYTGASALAYAAGDDKAGTGLSALQKQHFDQGSAGTSAYANVVQSVAALPYEQRRAAIQAAKPGLVSMGAHPADIDAFDPTNANIRALGHVGYTYKDQVADGIAKQNADTGTANAETGRITAENPIVVGQSLVTRGGQELFRAPQFINAPATDNVLQVPGTGSQGYVQSTGNFAPGSVTAEQLYRTAIEPQESHGQAGVVGPMTRYGQAQGASQMLPGTAAAMAKKIGVPWRPDLMTAKTPEGLQYQRQLGIAYAQVALDATGGDPMKAAMFYHGGPDQSIWGPKTQAYGQQAVRALTSQAIGQQSTSRTPIVVQHGSDPNAVDTNDPAIEQLARQYAATGEMPSMGSGNGQFRRAIITRGAQIAAENHWTPAQIAANKAQLKAGQGALAADNKMYDTIQSAEQTAIANGQRYIDLARQAPGNTSSTWYNTLRNGLGAAMSDTRVTDMNSAYTTFIGEYNRVVISTPSGSGTMSDSSRHEAIASFSNATSPEAKASAFEVLKKDMAARKQAQQAIIDRRTNLIANIGMTPSRPVQTASRSSAPSAAQQMLKQNPGMRAAFDAKYGAGASRQVLGS